MPIISLINFDTLKVISEVRTIRKFKFNQGNIHFSLDVFFKSLKKIVLFLLFILLIGGSLALGGGLGYFAGLVEEMEIPSQEELGTEIASVEQVSEMTYKDGSLISEVRADLVRDTANLDEISPYVINGLVATEDENFFDHQGIVPSAILRALANTFLGIGGSSGGSTITQQLVKQSLLTNEVSFERKAKEILLALRIEDFFSKEQILEAYLNISPYGRNNEGENVAGIEEAAQGIFGVSASDLSLAQASYLVGLPQNPYTYTPYQQGGQLKSQDDIKFGIERQHEVLDRMLLTNAITQAEYDEAMAYDIREDFLQPADPTKNNTNNFLYEAVNREAAEILMEVAITEDGLTWDEVYSDDELYNDYFFQAKDDLAQGGYTVQSTVDKDVYNAMNENAQNYAGGLGTTYYTEVTNPENGETTEVAEPVQTGQVLMDNATGAIIAFVGGRDFEVSQVDHAMVARRQPGSTIKPLLVYGPAMQEGIISPATLIADTYYAQEQSDGSLWEPSSFGSTISETFVTARHALAMSLNNPTVYLYEELLAQGVDTQKYMYNMGWDEAIAESEFINLGLSLGGTSVGPTVAELTSAFATFGNDGQYRESYLVESITDARGNKIYQHQDEVTQVFSPDVAYVMVDMLQSVISEGTWKDYQDDLNVDADWYVKTGTSENFNDLWVTASSPKVTLSSWVGYDNNLPGQGGSGGRTLDDGSDTATYGMPGPRATMYWINQVNALNAEFPDLLGAGETFDKPEGVYEAEVVEDTGTKAGNFEGPYNLEYKISESAKKKKEIFPASYKVPKANFNYVIGGKLDETVEDLENYRVKSDKAENNQATNIRRQYALRKQENQKALERIYQQNEN